MSEFLVTFWLLGTLMTILLVTWTNGRRMPAWELISNWLLLFFGWWPAFLSKTLFDFLGSKEEKEDE